MKNTVSRLQDCLRRNLNKAISIALSLALLLNITAEGFAQLLPSVNQNDFTAWQKESASQFGIEGILNNAYNTSKDEEIIKALEELIKDEYKQISLTAEELKAELELAYQAYQDLENLRLDSYKAGQKAYAFGKTPEGGYEIEKYFINACSDKEDLSYNNKTYECPSFMQGILSGILNDRYYKEEIESAILEKGSNPKSNNSVFAKIRDIALIGGVEPRDYPRFIKYIEGIASKAPSYCDNDAYLVDYIPGIEYNLSGKSRGLKQKSKQGKQKRQLDCINSGEAMVLLALLGNNAKRSADLINDSIKQAWDSDYGPIALESAATALSAIDSQLSWQYLEDLLLKETLKKKGFKGKAKAFLELLSVENASKTVIGTFNRYVRGGGGNYLNAYGEKTQYIIEQGKDKYAYVYGNILEDIGGQIAANKSPKAVNLAKKIIAKYLDEEAKTYAQARMLMAQNNLAGMLLQRDTGNKIHTPLVTGILSNAEFSDEKVLSARKLINNLDWWDINAATQTRINNSVFVQGTDGLTKKDISDDKQIRFKENEGIKTAAYWTDISLMVILTPALIKSIPSIIRGGANLAKTSYRLSRIKIAGKGRLLKAVKGRGAGINLAEIKAGNMQMKKLYDARKSAITKLRARQHAGKNISSYQLATTRKATAKYKLAKSERNIIKTEKALTPEAKAGIEAEINSANNINKSLYNKYITAQEAYKAKIAKYNQKAAEYNALVSQGKQAQAQELFKEIQTLQNELGTAPKAPQPAKLSPQTQDYILRYRQYEANLSNYNASIGNLKAARKGIFKEWLANSKLGRWWNTADKGNGLIFKHSPKGETTLAEVLNIKGEYSNPKITATEKTIPLNRADKVYNWLDAHNLNFAANTLRFVNNKATLLGTTLMFNYNVATITPAALNSTRVLAATEQVSNVAARASNGVRVFTLSQNTLPKPIDLGFRHIKPIDVVDPKLFNAFKGVPLIHGNIIQGRGASYWVSKLANVSKVGVSSAVIPALLARDMYKYADSRLQGAASIRRSSAPSSIRPSYYLNSQSIANTSSLVYEVPGVTHTLKHAVGTAEDILSPISAPVETAAPIVVSSEKPTTLLGRIAAFIRGNGKPLSASPFIYNFLAATTVTATAPMISQIYHLDNTVTNTLISAISYLPAMSVPFMGYLFSRYGVSNIARISALATFAGVGLTIFGGLNGFTSDGSLAGLISSLSGITLISLSNEMKYASIYPLIDTNFDRQKALSLTTQTAMARSLGTIAFLEFGPLLNFASESLGFGQINNAITFPLLLLPLSAMAFIDITRTNVREVPVPKDASDNGIKNLIRLFRYDEKARKAALSFALIEAGELTTSLLVFSLAKEHYGPLSDMPNILGGVLIYTAMGLARLVCGKLQEKGILLPGKTFKISGALVLGGLAAFAAGGISPLGLTGAAMFFIGDANLFPPLLNSTLKGRGEQAGNTTLLIFSFSTAAAIGGWVLSLVADISGSMQFAVLVPIVFSGTALGLSRSIFRESPAEEPVLESRESFDFAEAVVYASGEKEESEEDIPAEKAETKPGSTIKTGKPEVKKETKK